MIKRLRVKVFHKTITENTQVVADECYFVGADLYHTTDTNMIIYNEATSSETAAQIIAKLAVTAEMNNCHIDLAHPVKCEGIYVDWTAGLGTVYYALG